MDLQRETIFALDSGQKSICKHWALRVFESSDGCGTGQEGHSHHRHHHQPRALFVRLERTQPLQLLPCECTM